MRNPARLLLAALLLAGQPALSGAQSKGRRGGPVKTASEAKAIAEQETGGVAISARRTSLNGASCGWEVEVHMPREDKGWRCVIDCDTHAVFTKDRIPNPAKGRKK